MSRSKTLDNWGRRKPPISISLDLDNQWSYMKTHGDAGWESFPSYLDPLVNVLDEALGRHELTITVFVVGQDAALDANARALERLAAAGHEFGNHSFRHDPWLQRYTPAELDREIDRAESHIEQATGQRPRGFRGPGYSLSADVLRVLSERGYEYDASTFPTFLGPLARAYYFAKSRRFSGDEREDRKQLFGTTKDGLRPLKPYFWDVDGRRLLLEIPVTTMPVFRIPMHLSYLVYLAQYSKGLARSYLRTALRLCRLRGVQPSLLMHPLDFLGGDIVDALDFFPGMKLETDFKLRLFDEAMGIVKQRFRPVTMAEHARELQAEGGLETVPLSALAWD